MLLSALWLTLQSAVAPRLAIAGARPDLLLIVVIFLGLFAPPREAAIGAWILGAGGDVMSVERFGLMALSYLLVALVVSSIRGHLFRAHGLTQFLVTLIVGLAIRFAWLIYERIAYDPAAGVLYGLSVQVIWGALYTALCAPLVFVVLVRLSRPLGLPRQRGRAVPI